MIKTTSLETSKSLKESGFPQTNISTVYTNPLGMQTHLELYGLAMPTTDELLERLPNEISKWTKHDDLTIGFCIGGWYVLYGYAQEESHEEVNESLPEALAQMWLWLKKEKLI